MDAIRARMTGGWVVQILPADTDSSFWPIRADSRSRSKTLDRAPIAIQLPSRPAIGLFQVDGVHTLNFARTKFLLASGKGVATALASLKPLAEELMNRQ